ncbi:MAG: DUF5058 family protein, partial [Bacillota bacterium]|nr:DUF5058 family protein [Bacillota bacterium]
MTETIQRINPQIWIFAIVLIGFVVLQAAVFLKMALNFNKKHHVLTSQEVKDAVKTGAVSVIGPALSVVLLAMTLITFVGPATTFMRVGVIGSASYELNIANTAADAIGVSLGTEAVTESVFTLCLF